MKLPRTSWALKTRLLDSNAGVTSTSRDLLHAAFEQTNMVLDNAGGTKVVKTRARRSRDDAAQALLLACGEMARRPAPVELRAAVIGKDGSVKWL